MALPRDRETITDFLNQSTNTHRHLDWKSPTDWLGEQPFLLEMSHDRIIALLACLSDNPDAAWVRIFSTIQSEPALDSWQRLFPLALANLKTKNIKVLASLAIKDWFAAFLQKSGFINHQSMVVLEWNDDLDEKPRLNTNLLIRRMTEADLPAVYEIDRASFTPIWQYSMEEVRKSYHQSAYSTVACLGSEIVGYQVSTSMTICAHLARLAVKPTLQGQRIGYSLVYDILHYFTQDNFFRITVNTQSDNLASLNLYQRIGFNYTGETFPVYELDLT